MGSISMPQGKGNIRHNIRGYERNEWPDNIDRARTPDNVVWKHETMAHAYHRIFDVALNEYNSGQKRADRRIGNYRTHINNSKNGEKEFYEDVLQWGKKEDFEAHPELRQVAKECLVEYIKGFSARNPNLELVGAYIHMDEVSPHMHFDYIPVASGYKTGMAKRNSLDRAMKQMGFGKTLRDKKDNATKQWKEHEREVFKKICLRHGLEVDPERQLNRKNLSVEEYKEIKESVVQEALEEKATVENQVRAMQKDLKELQKDAQEAHKDALSAQFDYQHAVLRKGTLEAEIKRLEEEKAKSVAEKAKIIAETEKEVEKRLAEADKVVIRAGELRSEAKKTLQQAEIDAEAIRKAAVPEQIRMLQNQVSELERENYNLKLELQGYELIRERYPEIDAKINYANAQIRNSKKTWQPER